MIMFDLFQGSDVITIVATATTIVASWSTAIVAKSAHCVLHSEHFLRQSRYTWKVYGNMAWSWKLYVYCDFLQEKQGTIFTLIDSFNRENLGML